MTNTETGARAAMLAHHRAQTEDAGIMVASLTGAVAARNAYEPAAAELVAYLADEALPHASAAEDTPKETRVRIGRTADVPAR